MQPKATIYHNPLCSTSRNVLKALQEADIEVTVVEYLKAGWTKQQLQALLKAAGLSAREILRTNNTPAESLGLLAETASEEAILEAMCEHPVLVNRPIVCTEHTTLLCRPTERVQEIIDYFKAR